MSEDEDIQRVILSRQTLAAYEANGLPGGPKVDTLRMLAEEIMILRGLEARLKPQTSTISDLISRWERLRAEVKG